MKKEKSPITYETRYKHKLNMLEPGTVMLKWIGVLLPAGVVLWLFGVKIAACVVLGAAGALFLLLLILLAVEAHQDRVLNEIASRENKEE